MLSIIGAAALLAFSAINSSIADEKWDLEVRNGNWWRTRQPITKAIHITGMRDGVYAGVVALLAENPAGADSLQSEATRFKMFRTEQIVEGMNRFYSDKRMLDIDSSAAFHIVQLQLVGAPESQIQSLVRASKQAAPEYRQKEHAGK